MQRVLALDLSFDLKPVDPLQFIFFRKLEPCPPKQLFWVKVKGSIGELTCLCFMSNGLNVSKFVILN